MGQEVRMKSREENGEKKIIEEHALDRLCSVAKEEYHSYNLPELGKQQS